VVFEPGPRPRPNLVEVSEQKFEDKLKAKVAFFDAAQKSSVYICYHNNYAEFINKKLSYCWETVRRESMPRIAEMDVEMTT